MSAQRLRVARHVALAHVVRHHVLQQVEPEERELREHAALARDRGGQHHVERAQAVGRDDQQLVAEVVHVADLSAAPERARRAVCVSKTTGLSEDTFARVIEGSSADEKNVRPVGGRRVYRKPERACKGKSRATTRAIFRSQLAGDAAGEACGAGGGAVRDGRAARVSARGARLAPPTPRARRAARARRRGSRSASPRRRPCPRGRRCSTPSLRSAVNPGRSTSRSPGCASASRSRPLPDGTRSVIPPCCDADRDLVRDGSRRREVDAAVLGVDVDRGREAGRGSRRRRCSSRARRPPARRPSTPPWSTVTCASLPIRSSRTSAWLASTNTRAQHVLRLDAAVLRPQARLAVDVAHRDVVVARGDDSASRHVVGLDAAVLRRVPPGRRRRRRP